MKRKKVVKLKIRLEELIDSCKFPLPATINYEELPELAEDVLFTCHSNKSDYIKDFKGDYYQIGYYDEIEEKQKCFTHYDFSNYDVGKALSYHGEDNKNSLLRALKAINWLLNQNQV
jgi:hypothetical protein